MLATVYANSGLHLMLRCGSIHHMKVVVYISIRMLHFILVVGPLISQKIKIGYINLKLIY